MQAPIVFGLVRHVLTLVAGALASKGAIAANEQEVLVGSILGLGGILGSIFDKKKRRG